MQIGVRVLGGAAGQEDQVERVPVEDLLHPADDAHEEIVAGEGIGGAGFDHEAYGVRRPLAQAAPGLVRDIADLDGGVADALSRDFRDFGAVVQSP